MLDARAVANKFIELAKSDNNLLTPMQILKLTYMSHGWMLGLYSLPLFKNRIEAWKFGPVIPILYGEMKGKGSRHVTSPLNAPYCEFAPVHTDLFDQVYRKYGRYTGNQLSQMTHQKDTPWDKVYKEGEFNIEIPNDLIEEHYRKLAS